MVQKYDGIGDFIDFFHDLMQGIDGNLNESGWGSYL
jgi:hypothetical protein